MVYVHRRTGGLEMNRQSESNDRAVHRRTGGLETFFLRHPAGQSVHRRTGGLEMHSFPPWVSRPVHRRTGGLERQWPWAGRALFVHRRRRLRNEPNDDMPSFVGSPPYRRLRKR